MGVVGALPLISVTRGMGADEGKEKEDGIEVSVDLFARNDFNYNQSTLMARSR